MPGVRYATMLGRSSNKWLGNAGPRLEDSNTTGGEDLDWESLDAEIVNCAGCPRLLAHCRQVGEAKRRAYRNDSYWGRPVPNFVGQAASRSGPPLEPAQAATGTGTGTATEAGGLPRDLLIVGLAPGAHGANRTGRMFTGDRSGDWLYRALHRGGLASQAESESRQDGLTLYRTVITAVCHCAPPDNRPRREEIARCQPFLEQTVQLARPRVILALGRVAWDAVIRLCRERPECFAYQDEWQKQLLQKRPAFAHGSVVQLSSRLALVGSYHPSQQNTFTKRLTEAMLDQVITTVVSLLPDVSDVEMEGR